MPIPRCKLLTAVAFIFSTSSQAASFFYPGQVPVPQFYSPAPAWLSTAKSDDGYISVKASVEMTRTCVPFGSAGFLGIFNKKTLQLYISAAQSGLSGPLESKELPIATIDGRAQAGGCVIITKLPAVLVGDSVIPEISPGVPNAVQLAIRTRTTSDVNLNLVGAAQTVLGVASVFATAGAGATITGFTATLAKPAFALFQGQLEKEYSTITPAERLIKTNWDELRKGVSEYSIPFYLGETTLSSGSVGQAIDELEGSSEAGKTPDFIVHINLVYRESIFGFEWKPLTCYQKQIQFLTI